jgi:inhibitor of KinA
MTLVILSESSVAVTFGDSIGLKTHRKVLAFNDWLSANPFPGLLDVVPAYASVTVFFDPILVKNHWREQPSPARAVHAFLEKQVSHFSNPPIPDSTNPQLVQIPVCYNGADLAEVAGRLHLSENEVIKLHTEAVYTVFMIGFLPGFPYLGPLPEAIELPRRDTPRLRVPAGSVAIAGRQTGIYPQESPGGWHLIGRTDFRLFDPLQSPPAFLQPGMQVRFISA